MAEKPLERLNYHNGQRLEAADLKAEQDYHIRTRRWLNKSLYSAGIASGLEIHAEPNTAFVVVSPGMALDNEGREIILLQEERVEVKGYAPGSEDLKVQGPYITIEYAEETISDEHGSCIIRGTKGKAQSTVAWGGPARVRAKPILSLSPFLPYAKSNKIVLAQVEVDTKCNISQINFSVRHYVGASSAATVHQYALEGEREVARVVTKDDHGNDKDVEVKARIYFHIRGRQPNGITLYLRAEEVSQLYYTELGLHNHAISVNVGSLTIPQHEHTITPITTLNIGNGTGPAGGHTPSYTDIRARTQNIIFNKIHGLSWTFWDPPVNVDQTVSGWADFRILFNAEPDHVHTIPGSTELNTATPPIPISGGGSSSNTGVSNVSARYDTPIKMEKALTYVDSLEITIDGIPQTQNILNQIINERPAAERPLWKNKLGDGTSNHPFAIIGKDKGTGPIRLNFLQDTNFSEGEHVIELVAPRILEGGKVKPNGGKIIYNLYIE